MAETGIKRRIDVMVSSTFVDMKDCREVVIQAIQDLDLNATGMENNPAPNAHVIEASYALVDAADIYVGLFGLRYGDCPVCPKRNPKGLSLTELEFDRAVKSEIPRLMFEVGDDFAVPAKIAKLAAEEGDDIRAKRAAFRRKIADDRPLEPFDNPHELHTKADKALEREKRKIEARPRKPPKGGGRTRTEAARSELYALNAPYVMQRALVGRVEELSRIDAWAQEPDGGMLLFRAIGGMGKSALTWHWARKRATEVRGDWAGRLWYSFYLHGATLKDFLVRALVHMTGQAAETLKVESSYDLGSRLRAELDSRPWLLVLDGLERVLVAYHQPGKEAMSDEDAHLGRDGLELDRKARDCIRPDDDQILAMLAQAGKGKVLMSSRLLPQALTSDGTHTIPGVRDYPLVGLAKADAARLLTSVDVKTQDEAKMQDYLERTFACHPLSVLVIPGVMRKHKPVGPLDFDSWAKSPNGGRAPELLADSLRGRQNHILAIAFATLSDDDKMLLSSLTLLSSDLTYDIAVLLNPKRPLEPEVVLPPVRKTEREIYGATFFAEVYEAYWIWERTQDLEEERRCQTILNRYIDEDFASQEEAYEAWQVAQRMWQKSAEEADQWLWTALQRLTDRGLIQYDPSSGVLDIHPAVRHTAQGQLSGKGRQQTGRRVADALASRAEPAFTEVEDVAELSFAMDRVRALCAGGQMEPALRLLGEGLEPALYRLGASAERLELLQAWFPEGWSGDIALEDAECRSVVLNWAAICLVGIGQDEAGQDLYRRKALMDLKGGNLKGAAIALKNLAGRYKGAGRWFEAERLYSLSGKVAEASGSAERIAITSLDRVGSCIGMGRLDEARAILDKIKPLQDRGDFEDNYNARLANAVLNLAWRAGEITDSLANETLATVRRLRRHVHEKTTLTYLAQFRQGVGKHADAVTDFDQAIAMARRMGSVEVAGLEAERARSLLALGRPNDATRIVQAAKASSLALAELCLDLGDHDQARGHALKGYKKAWADGPPYCDYWGLEDCRKVLAAVGEPEPDLPAFDASRYPAEFAKEVEDALARTAAERAGRQGDGDD